LTIDVNAQAYLERVDYRKTWSSIGTLAGRQIISCGEYWARIGEIEQRYKGVQFWSEQKVIEVVFKIGQIASDYVEHATIYNPHMVDIVR